MRYFYEINSVRFPHTTRQTESVECTMERTRFDLWGQPEVTQHFSNCNRRRWCFSLSPHHTLTRGARWSPGDDKKLINNLSHIFLFIIITSSSRLSLLQESTRLRHTQFVTMRFHENPNGSDRTRRRAKNLNHIWEIWKITQRSISGRQWFHGVENHSWMSTTEADALHKI